MHFEILRGIWELLMPRTCFACGRRLHRTEHYLCAACLSKAPMDLLTSRMEALEHRLGEEIPLAHARSLYRYGKDPEARRLVFHLKYHGHPDAGLWMGQLLARRLQDTGFFEGVDALVPVPLHPRKQRRRGYNQAEMLARGIAGITGLPVLTDAVERVSYTRTQTHLDPVHRQRNVAHVFRAGNTEGLAGRHLLFIDDVLTTGSTIMACIRALDGVAGLRVSILTFAYVDHGI